jgi:2'-5' RNA ligase
MTTVQQLLVNRRFRDLVPIRWLHLTTYIVGFVDEIRQDAVTGMIAETRRLLAPLSPIPIILGRIFYRPEAVTLPAEPVGALNPILDAVRAASEAVGCSGHTDTNPWRPHLSVAYSRRR